MRLNRSTVRRGITAFWALWFLIVCATNLCDGLKALEVLPPQWKLASGNYHFMQIVTARYQTPEIVTAILFLGVILWEGLATALFWRAVFQSRKESNQVGENERLAFGVGMALMAGFVLTDEIFIVYDVEAAHLRLLVAQMVSLMFLELVLAD